MISDMSVCFGFQPRMFRALSLEAMRALGSPGLLAAALTFMSLSVTCRAASAISDTENPLLDPKLKMPLSPPFCKYSRARIWASIKSET